MKSVILYSDVQYLDPWRWRMASGEWEQPADIRAGRETSQVRRRLGQSRAPETLLRMLLAATRDRSQERWDSREQTPLTHPLDCSLSDQKEPTWASPNTLDFKLKNNWMEEYLSSQSKRLGESQQTFVELWYWMSHACSMFNGCGELVFIND